MQGSQEVLYPVMHWAVTRLPELKKRAYLSNYLMKIDVPDDMLQDEQVAETNSRVRLTRCCAQFRLSLLSLGRSGPLPR